MNREEFMNRLNELMIPYLEKKEEIRQETREKETQKQIRLEQINIEKNTLKLRLERLKENKEDEIKKYIEQSYNSNYGFDYRYISSLRKELENSYQKKEEELENQIKQLEDEEQKLQNLDYSYLVYDKRLPGIRETIRVGLNRLMPQIENSIQRKKLELQLVDIDIKEVRNRYPSWQAEEALSNLQPYYKLKEEISNQIRELEDLLSEVKYNYKLTFVDDELNNMLKSNLNKEMIIPTLSIKEEYIVTQSEQKELTVEEEKVEEVLEPATQETIEEVFEQQLPTVSDELLEKQIDDVSLKQIISKICDDKEIDDKQSSRYVASKIKIFNFPRKENLSLEKIKTIPGTIIGIIPRTAMKLYGKLLSTDAKKVFSKMEESALKLTDNEVEVLLKEYSNDVVPNGFSEIVKPRINLYLSKRLDEINEEINAALINIERCKEIINSSEDKALVDEAYIKANSCIKSLITYQIEVDSLLKNSKLHSYESKLKPLKSKLNYVGGRFETAKDYDSSLWSRVSGLSQKIEYSLDPVEVVNSYFERENIYKQHNRYKDYIPKSRSENEIQLKKVDTTSSNSNESKFSEEIKNTIEDLRAMRAQLTDDDVKEIESLLRR